MVHPANQPDLHVLVAEQLLVDPSLRIVADQVLPEIGPEHQIADETAQLGPRQISVGRSPDHAAASSLAEVPSRRSGLLRSIASAAASPSRSGGAGSTTGRSDP